MAYIQRSLEKVVEQVTKEYPVVLVTGPRQVGKTTMLKKLMEGSSRGYVSLDDLNDRALAKNDPELFLQLHKPPVLIDEVQYAPELFTYIKVYADIHQEPGAFWLTGSQVFKLMRGVQESLAGRVAVLSMTSLSQSELNGAETEPFRVDLDDLLKRERQSKSVDTKGIFERIYASRLCCVSSRFVLRFLSASSAGSNTKRFPPVSVPAVRQEPPQGNGYLKISSAPGQKTDKFRHSPALENTRLWCLVGQTFLRSNIQERFPVSTSPPAYGQRQRTHGE